MSKKNKKTLVILILLSGLFFLLGEEPDNSGFKNSLHSVSRDEVVIIFNSGGWGDTPIEEADDFGPIVQEIQNTLKEFGHDSVILEYTRSKESILGRIEGMREIATAFPKQSEKMASEIREFLRNNPGHKIVMAGLSNGGAFIDRVMEKLSFKDNVFAVEVGTPFWEKVLESDNVLLLDHDGKDPLSSFNLKSLVASIIKAPYDWLVAQIASKTLSFSKALRLPGHYYSWSDVASKIRPFLEEKFVLL